MKTYSAEQDIKDEILASTDIEVPSVGLKIKSEPNSDALIRSLEHFIKNSKSEDNSQKIKDALSDIRGGNHPDLLYGSAIMVSTVMNANDDVFLPEDTWESRATVLYQPFNDKHRKKDIIGHIVDYRVLGEEGDIISDDQDVCPDFFDIEVDWVVYSSIFPEISKDIQEKAPKYELGVSMEARMTDFCYAIFDETSADEYTVNIVERNEDTAFLTKHLRAYSGSGEYQGQKIGRVPKEFRFKGMGNVTNPANERSQYTRINDLNISKVESVNNLDCISLTEATANKQTLIVKDSDPKGKNTMATKIDNVDEALKHIEKLEAQIEDFKSQESQKEIDELKAKVQELESAKGDLEQKVTTAEEKLEASENSRKEKEDELTKANEEKEKIEADLKEKSEELEKIEAEKVGQTRVAELKELGRKFDDEAAAVTKYAGLSEDAYAEIKEAVEQLKPTDEKAETHTGKMDEEDKKDKKKKRSKSETKAEEDLEDAKENEDPEDAVAQSGEGDTEGELGEVVAKALSARKSRQKKITRKNRK